jgi:hypothetical protein
MTGNDSQLFATGVYGVVKTAACFVFLVFVADSLGRRWSLLWTAASQGIFLFIVSIYGRVQPPIKGEPVSGRTLRPSPFARRLPRFGPFWLWNAGSFLFQHLELS